ncbi:hypothetical protein E4U31_001492 [Claviceps sp. LM219 group G6]|nr:hypothetical protein E4U31_001492 [Claviceps sp. LM219 group G6]
MDKDDVDKLSRDNYEDWFRRQKAILKEKRVFYTLEKTFMEFAYVREIGDTTGPEVVIPFPPSPTLGGSSSAQDAAVDAITEGISRLGGSWDEKKKEQWENDDAKALPIIIKFHSSRRILHLPIPIPRLGGSWDEKKKEQWENDDAKALPIIMKGLGSKDAIFADSSETY